MESNEISSGISAISRIVSKYISLLIEDTRLNVTEKLTRLLSAVALASLLTIIVTVAMVFVSIAVAIGLAESLSPLWSFIIVAGFYIVLLIILITCRKVLLINPIARFLSTIILNPPTNKDSSNDQPTPVS